MGAAVVAMPSGGVKSPLLRRRRALCSMTGALPMVLNFESLAVRLDTCQQGMLAYQQTSSRYADTCCRSYVTVAHILDRLYQE